MTLIDDSNLDIIFQKWMDNPEVIERLASRITRKIASGPSKGNQTVTQIGEMYFTCHQLDRFKKAFIFLMMNDREFKLNMKNTMRKHLQVPFQEPLTKGQMIKRIQDYGCVTFMYKYKMCGYFASEIYAVFPEYGRPTLRSMLVSTGLLIRATTKKNPFTHKNNKAFILDI